jgi:hypothetical protein
VYSKGGLFEKAKGLLTELQALSSVHTKSSPPRRPLTRTGSNGRALDSISSQDAAAKGITNPHDSMKGTIPENFHSINGL